MTPVGVTASGIVIGLVLGLGDGVASLIIPWICIHAMLAMSMRLVMRAGEINLAVGAFYGIGAYGAAQMNLLLEAPLLVSVAVGALVAAVASLVFGIFSLRVTGAAFILVSFAFNEVLRLALTKADWLGGNSGLVGIFADPRTLVGAMVVATGAIALGLLALERSRWGRQFAVVENKPLLASCSGINPRGVKMLALVVSGAVAGTAGGFFAQYSSVVAPTDFSYMISISVLAFVMIGGRDYLIGAVVGATVLTYVSEELRAFGTYEPVIYGGALMLAIVAMPSGLVGSACAASRGIVRARRGPEATSTDAVGIDDPRPATKERV